MDLKSLSKNDLIRLVKGMGRQIEEQNVRYKKMLWIVGALVQKLGGDTSLSKPEMEEVLVTKQLATHQDTDTDCMIFELVDRPIGDLDVLPSGL